MLKVVPVLGALMAAGSYEPAHLTRAYVEKIPFNVAAAGLVVLDVTIDARGGVSAVSIVKDVDPFGSTLKEELAGWEFEPAREDGRAVESQILVAGLFRPAMLLFPAPPGLRPPDTEPPKSMPYPTSVAVPPYPPTAVGQGAVLVEVEVSAEGRVEQVRLVGSAESAFEAPALDAARAWVFRPARSDGRAVHSRAYIVFSFRWPTTSDTDRRSLRRH
jgi:TonB family protein